MPKLLLRYVAEVEFSSIFKIWKRTNRLKMKTMKIAVGDASPSVQSEANHESTAMEEQ